MLTLRAVLLYLFALAAALPALVAWDPELQQSKVKVVLWALGLAGALVAGLRLEPALTSIEAKRRRLLAAFLGTLQMSALGLAVALAAVRPSPGLLAFLSSFLAGYFLIVLGLVGLSPHPRAVLGHGLGLAALGCLRGGATGVFAAVAVFALGALFVSIDHHARILAAYRVDPDRHAERALARALGMVLPVAALLLFFLSFAPQETPMGRSFTVTRKTEARLSREAFRGIIIAGVGGAAAVYAAGRFVTRTKRKEKKTLEVAEPFRGQPERIEPPTLPARPRRAAGRRGRIIHAYLTLLETLAKGGFRREPSETPAEFAAALGEPQRPLETLTTLFTSARWGPTEPRDEEVSLAESASGEVAAATARRPPRRRGTILEEGPRRPEVKSS